MIDILPKKLSLTVCISTQERQVGKEKENNVSTTINYNQLATIMLMQ